MRLLTRTVAVVFVGTLLLVSGCDTLDLDTEPRTELSSDAIWQDATLIKNYLADIYNNTGVGYGDPMQTPGAVDEALNIHGHPGGANIQSNMTAADRGIWSSPGWRPPDNPPYRNYYWPNVYSSIRDLNLLLENVKGNEQLPTTERETILGEAYFLRAYFYHNLMQKHGGVPLIEQVFELSGDLSQYQVPRGTFKETIDFIVQDLDRAADRLSLQARQKGAASKGAALALKSRVLLYAASDLYEPTKSPFSMEEVTYTGDASQRERWERARDAAQAVIELGQYQLEPASSSREYHKLFTKGNEGGTIWARYFSAEGGWAHNQSQWVSPNGYNSWTGDAPTQQHVDAYEMEDGSEFEWEGADPVSASEPVDAKNPYDDRDPRFEANILYNNAEWRPRPAALRPSEGQLGIIQTGSYESPDGKLRPGLDTRGSSNQSWNGTKTGYNLKKFVDRDINPNQEQAYNPYVYIRYAEVLLNYAEAQYELQGNATSVGSGMMSAKEALDRVRDRVGMPGVPPDGGPNRTFVERIRQEREVELAFEGHRYFDVRRWMIGPEAYQDAMAVQVVGRLTDESDPEAQKLVNNWYDYEYNVIAQQERQWNDPNYFVPIPQDEMDRNPELVQNPGY